MSFIYTDSEAKPVSVTEPASLTAHAGVGVYMGSGPWFAPHCFHTSLLFAKIYPYFLLFIFKANRKEAKPTHSRADKSSALALVS